MNFKLSTCSEIEIALVNIIIYQALDYNLNKLKAKIELYRKISKVPEPYTEMHQYFLIEIPVAGFDLLLCISKCYDIIRY